MSCQIDAEVSCPKPDVCQGWLSSGSGHMHYLIQAVGAHMGQERLCAGMAQDVILWHPGRHLQAASLHFISPKCSRVHTRQALRLLLNMIGTHLRSFWREAIMGLGTCLDVSCQVESCKAAGPINLLCAQLPYDPLWEASKCACDGLDLSLTCSGGKHPQALSAFCGLVMPPCKDSRQQKAAAADSIMLHCSHVLAA